MKINSCLVLFILIIAFRAVALGAGTTTDPPDARMEQLRKANAAQRASAEAAAKEFLRKPIAVPVPPSVTLKCHHKSEDKDEVVIKQFLDEFNKPEYEVLKPLLTTGRSAQLMGTDYDGSYHYELRLLARLTRKAAMLIDMYKGQEDRYIPVVRAALSAEKSYTILGGAVGDGDSLLPRIAEWAKQIADKFLKELVEQHEYANLHPIGKIAKEAALLSANMDDYMERLDKATTFEFEYDLSVNPGKEDAYEAEVKGKANVKLLGVSNVGSGTANYASFKMNADELMAVMDNMPNTFSINIGVTDFMPCESESFNITLDRFGGQSETITVTVPEAPAKTTTTSGFVQKIASDSFSEMREGSIYKFNVTLRNGEEIAVEQTFNGSARKNDAELTIKLTHKPRK